MDDLTKLTRSELAAELDRVGSLTGMDEPHEAANRLRADDRTWQRNLERERDGLRAELADANALVADLDDLNEECAELKRNLKAEADGNAALRRKHGAHHEETMGMFIARLAHGCREWGHIMEALRNFHRGGPTRDVMPACELCSGLGYVVFDASTPNELGQDTRGCPECDQ